jgi:hypothetical protein
MRCGKKRTWSTNTYVKDKTYGSNTLDIPICRVNAWHEYKQEEPLCKYDETLENKSPNCTHGHGHTLDTHTRIQKIHILGTS